MKAIIDIQINPRTSLLDVSFPESLIAPDGYDACINIQKNDDILPGRAHISVDGGIWIEFSLSPEGEWTTFSAPKDDIPPHHSLNTRMAKVEQELAGVHDRIDSNVEVFRDSLEELQKIVEGHGNAINNHRDYIFRHEQRLPAAPPQDDEDDSTPCEVCRKPVWFGSRHVPCGEYAMRMEKRVAPDDPRLAPITVSDEDVKEAHSAYWDGRDTFRMASPAMRAALEAYAQRVNTARGYTEVANHG